MATRIYGVSRGETEFDITEGVGSPTSADDVEVTIDFDASVERSEALQALDMIKNHIIKGDWPPA